MLKVITALFIIAFFIFSYFGYTHLIRNAFTSIPEHRTGTTERLLKEQRLKSAPINQDYRRTIEDSRRTMEENRRAMEDLRRQTQR